ncbi:hypothetical protein H2O73_05720 [Vibrio sp. 404]|uniref:Outer membrane protein beta-barrel domain-containing protein n=1 Tax=Vibrio marinisediminis TaxID=2758441 RepID=A0A7W2ITA6_9VIBR|nr:hypothetical protein [Vibrio marinisediminis]MBA5761842.1 hypothetical protein [Vibrio marinisediminis]
MKAVVGKFVLGSVVVVTSLSAYANNDKPADLAIGLAVDQQLSVVVELDNQYRFIIGNQGAAFDYIAKRGQFNTEEPVNWYVGLGGWGEWDDGFGVRVPLGVSYQVSDGWQLYGQVQPELDMHKGWELGVGAAMGATYHF